MSTQPSPIKPRCATCGKTAAFRCTGCYQERYCSIKCQKEHWFAGHKAACKRDEREAPEAAGSVSPSSSPSASRAPALDVAPAQQSQPINPHPPSAQGPSSAFDPSISALAPQPLHSDLPQAPVPSASATTPRPQPPSAPAPLCTHPSAPAPRRRLPQQNPHSNSTTGSTSADALANDTQVASNTTVNGQGGSSASTSAALCSHPLLDVSISSTSSHPPDSPPAASLVTAVPREPPLGHDQPPAPQPQQAPTGSLPEASRPQTPPIRGRVPNHALPASGGPPPPAPPLAPQDTTPVVQTAVHTTTAAPMHPRPPPGPPPPPRSTRSHPQPHHAQPPLAGSSDPTPPATHPTLLNNINSSSSSSSTTTTTTTKSAPRSGSPSLRRGFLNSHAVAVTSASSPSSLATAALSAVPAASPGCSRDSSPLRRGFLNAPPKRAAGRAQQGGPGASRSILEDLQSARQGAPSSSSLPAAEPAPSAVHLHQHQLGPLCMLAPDQADAQSASVAHAALPPVVLKGCDWGSGLGTHISALNQDVLWEVLRLLPPRALLMAGMTCRAWQQLALADSLWAPLFEPVLGTPPPAWLIRTPPSLTEQQAGTNTATVMVDTSDVRQQSPCVKHQPLPSAAARVPQPPSARPFLVSGVRGAMALRSQQQQQQQVVDSAASLKGSGSGSCGPNLKRTGSGRASRAERASSLVSHPLEGLDEVSDAAESPRSPVAWPVGGRPTKLPALPPGVLPRPPLYQVLGYELRLRRNWRTGRYATHSLREHTGNVECLELVDTAVFGRTLVSCAWDGAVHVYALPSCNYHPALKLRDLRRPVVGHGLELRGPRCVRRWMGHTGWITSMAAGRHYVVTVGVDRRMTVHAYSDEGSNPYFVAPHPAELTCVRFAYRDSGCETMVITGSKDGSILLWDIASKQLVHKYQGAQDVVWNQLTLPLSALHIPNNPTPLEDSISAQWLYDSVRATAQDKRMGGGRTGARCTADEVDAEGEGGDSARMFYGFSFVSTSRDGKVLLWALPPLLRRRVGAGITQPPAWELHAGDRCSEDGEYGGGSASRSGSTGPAWEFRALVRPSSRPPPQGDTQGGTAGGQTGSTQGNSQGSTQRGHNGIQGGGGHSGSTAAAAAAAGAPETVPHSQPTLMPCPPLSSATTAGGSRSRRGASIKHQEQANDVTGGAGMPLLPPTLPASPLLELSGRSSAILTSDVWLPEKGSMQEEWARKEGLVGLLATGAADGTVKVWRIRGKRLGQSDQQHQLRRPPSHHINSVGAQQQEQEQQEQQEQDGCMVLTQHQSGVMSIRFGLMPLATAGPQTTGNSKGSTPPCKGVDEPRERRLVVITGLMEAVKVWDPVSGRCLCQIDHPTTSPMGVANVCTFPDFLVTLAMVDGLLAYHCTGLQSERGAAGSNAGASTSNSPQPLQVQPVHGFPFRAILSMIDPCQSPSAALAQGPGAIAVGSGTGDVTLIDFCG